MRADRRDLEIDRISFQLGMINCFAEMVACGVKKLALSPPLKPEDYELLREASERIVEGFGIRSYIEKSLMVTGLQSEDFTRGKWSVLYYDDDAVLRRYLDLKAQQLQMREAGRYDGAAQERVSREFMRLLSYPEEKIDQKLAGDKTSSPFMLIE